jgi:hypothetical protein
MDDQLRGPASHRLDAGDQPDTWGRARGRLRDLRGRDRILAIAIVVLVLTPFAVALVRAFGDGWIPSGDEANIATRALDVFSRHPPLTGLPSTSGLYGDQITTNHPGPIEFYLLAVPVRALGLTVGPLLTAAAINCACVLVAAWVFLRRLGLSAMLWAGVLLLAVMWSGGTAVLTDTLSSNMTMYSVLCTAVLAWALVDGDIRLLPLAALVASYAAQQHLAAGLMVIALVVVAMAALVVQIAIRVRRGEPGVKKTALLSAATALAIAAVCWLPVLIDQFTGHPGNLTAIVRFARDNTRPTVGLSSGFTQALHAVTPPTVLGHTSTTGAFFLTTLDATHVSLGVLIVGALGALAWGARGRAGSVARLALIALVVLVAGVVDGSNVPMGIESGRVNLYRWTWAAAFLSWVALGLGIALLAARAVGRSERADRAHRLGPPALLVVAALIATSIAFTDGRDDHNRELPSFTAERRIAAAVLSRVDRRRPLLVVEHGNDAILSVGPYVILRLVEAGVDVSSFDVSIYGSARRYRPQSHPTVVVITSGKAQLPSGPGELLAREPFGPGPTQQFDEISAERTTLLDTLARSALGAKVVLTPGTSELIKRRYSPTQRYAIGVRLAQLPTDPRSALDNPDILTLVGDGRFRSPAFDSSEARRLLDLPPTHFQGPWHDEQVEALRFDSLQQAGIAAP